MRETEVEVFAMIYELRVTYITAVGISRRSRDRWTPFAIGRCGRHLRSSTG
jgi:hypothetical protein